MLDSTIFVLTVSIVSIYVFRFHSNQTESKMTSGPVKMKKSNFRLLLLIAFYALFLILGAAIFSAIESPLERTERNNMQNRINKFAKSFPCLIGKGNTTFLSKIKVIVTTDMFKTI